MNTKRTLICRVVLLSALTPLAWGDCVSPAGARASNQDNRYVISLYGNEIYDTKTDITWQRCPYGWFLTPDGKACQQMQGSGGWSQALSGYSGRPLDEYQGILYEQKLRTHHLGPPEWVSQGWTIPSSANLSTLLDRVCKHPAINQEKFPDTPPGKFWTSDVELGFPIFDHDRLFVVDFAGDGSTHTYLQDTATLPIRLMHKGKTPAIRARLEKEPVATQ